MARRGLVLGGGGPVGIAWESGLLVGLAEAGVDLAASDRIVGTSAGSVVGAHLALGTDLAARAARAYSSDERKVTTESYASSVAPRMRQLMEAMTKAATWEGPPEEAMQELGRFALAAETAPEERFLEGFADLAGREWPSTFACTAVDAVSGRFVVWDADAGVPLERAVASSCSVPGVFPPVTIGDTRYIDGGMRSPLNADLATGCDSVVVVSVTMLDAEGVTDPRFLRMRQRRREEVAALEAAGAAVTLIGPGPEFLEVSGMGLFLMDSSRTAAAYAAGLRQGAQEAARLQ